MSRYGSSTEVIKATAEELHGRFKFVKGQNFNSPHLNSSQIELYTRAFMGKFFVDLPDIISMLEDGSRSSFREALVRDAETWNDCSHPRRLNRTKFLTHGVAHMLVGIDSSVLEAAGVPELIRKEVFREVGEGIKFPEFTLLSDSSLYQDGLLSLFGGDRYALLSQMIGSEDIEILSSENLKQGVQKYLEESVEDPSQTTNWTWIQMVTDDLPIYPEFRAQCRSALETFEPFAVRKDGFRSAWFVLRAASYQVMHLEDETLRQKYRDYVLEMVKREITDGAEETSDSDYNALERRVGALIEIASILSNVPNDSVASNREFTSLLEVMSDLWLDFRANYGRVLSREVWNLPVRESESWWHLILTMRASK